VSAGVLLRRIVSALDAADVPYMIVGSFASTWHGAPRTTQDIDIVIDPTTESLDVFLDSLGDDGLYVAPSARTALSVRDQFNVIDPTSGWKVDLVVRKDRPYSREELSRRVRARILDVDTFTASAEDTVLSKLEWSVAAGGSDRQLSDAARVLAVGGDLLDRDYLDRWASALGVTEVLARARRLAEAP
jgi:hypothetical protein